MILLNLYTMSEEQKMHDKRKNLLEELENLQLPQIPGSIKQAEIIMSCFKDKMSSLKEELNDVESLMREKGIEF